MTNAHGDVHGDATAITGVIDRPRLYQVLDSAMVRVCVVQGPSGSGKTTLLRSWAMRRRNPDPLVWVSLSSGVTTRQAFWQHVTRSASRMGDLSEETTAEIENRLSVAVDPVRIASGLLADAGPVILVFDAYEHLGEAAAEIDRDLAQLLAAAPDLRVMITTRTPSAIADADPPGGVARVVALSELAFTPDEVSALVAAQTGVEDDRIAASIAHATQGFALTVRAVVLTLAQLGRMPRIDSAEWNAVIATRLESLLPSTVPAQFVVDTAVPPYVDVTLAQQLSGREDAAELLHELERNGFGRWIPYSSRHPVFQYVETIRDTFRTRAKEDAERFRRSCVTTAIWLLANEEVVEQALRFAIEGGDYALADRVFVSVVIGNPDSYISTRFLPALRTVPESVLGEYPMLAFGLALALGSDPILRADMPRIARIAIESTSFPPYIEPSVDAFSHASMRAIAWRLALEFRRSAAASLEIVRSAEDLDPRRVPDPGLAAQLSEHVGTVLRQLGYSLFQGGEIEAAMATIERSVALCPTQKTRNYSVVYAAGYSAFIGDIPRASALAASIDAEAWPAELRNTYMNGPGLIAEGYTRLDAFDFDGAADVLRSASSYLQTAEFWPFLTGIAVSARQGQGRARAEAERVTNELAATVAPPGVGDNVATERLRAALTLAWLACGDRRRAAEALEGQPADSPFLGLARIALLLAEARDHEAADLTEGLLRLPGHTLRTRAEVRTVGAVAALRCGERERAWAWLSAAAVAGETYGPRSHVALIAPRDRRALWEFARERESFSLMRALEVPAAETRTTTPLGIALTRRESAVLAALAEHGSNRAVAEALVVSPHTVKSHLQSIYHKLGVSSGPAAVAAAREMGLLRDAPDRP